MTPKEKVTEFLWELDDLLKSYELRLSCQVKVDSWGKSFKYLKIKETNTKYEPETFVITTEFQDVALNNINRYLKSK